MSDIDMVLTSQLVVAWAGETGEERRLAWWRCDLASEYGGEDLFRRLLPSTWRWAAFQGAREAARRVDEELRRRDHEPDRIVSLFSLGFELDERIEERLADLKRSGRAPDEALPGLAVTDDGWHPENFWDWVAGHGEAGGTASRPAVGSAGVHRLPWGSRYAGSSRAWRRQPRAIRFPISGGRCDGPARDDPRAHAAVTVRP